MNIGYVFDLDGIISEEDLHIPFLSGIYCFKKNHKDLSASEILSARDKVMEGIHQSVGKHLYFFVLNFDKEKLAMLSNCISGIQGDTQHFNSNNNEVHVVCSFKDDGQFNASAYEKAMPCLTNNRICVYSWFVGQYDHNGDRLIRDKRRDHGIARLVSLLTHQDEVSKVLAPMTQVTESKKPIYNLFGDATAFFDEEARTRSVRNYYAYKSIQHLLNISDNRLDEYFQSNVIPYQNDPKELEKRIDTTSEEFLKEQRLPIEASLITEKTQGMLLKTSETDEAYLVNATDNKLVFIEKLSKTQGWQMEPLDVFLTKYQDKVWLDNEVQESVSSEFLEKLYKENYIVHERDGFDKINNVVSDSRKDFVEKFKGIVDKNLNGFLDKHGSQNYESLQEILTEQERRDHRANLDYGIAFMDYLEAGKSDYLVDRQVSMGDINLKTIKDSAAEEESKRRRAYEAKRDEIEDKYTVKEEGKPSKIKESFNERDQYIMQCYKEKKRCDYDIQHLIDTDSEKKLTSSARALIAIGSGILAAILWLVISIKWLSHTMNYLFEDYGRFQWKVFSGLILAGLVVGAIIFIKAWLRRKKAIEELKEARQQKRNFMNDCVNEIIDVTKLHYDYLLAYHGLKTVAELADYVLWKKDDIVNFRKTLFRLMWKYKLAVNNNGRTEWDDDNTIELFDNQNAETLLFGEEGKKNKIPYCFGQEGVVLSDTFMEFKRKKARWETSRTSLNYTHTSQNFDQKLLENEVIPCMSKHQNSGLNYSPLEKPSILPMDDSGVIMEDIRQGSCGDCYFLATLAAIAKTKPSYIIGKNGMVEELGDDHRFFRVKFYDKDKNRINVDVDNRFWIDNNGYPIYAKQGDSKEAEGASYDPWVMAVEKAWAKTNGDGYDGIQGTSMSKEQMRRVEYSFAVTGKSAFYCNTKNVSDNSKLLEMIKKHFCKEGLPITLYSVNEGESKLADPNIVHFHAYALKSVNDDNTFDIFNPWNDHGADEDVRGKHYEHVDIQFIKDNFGVVVFFGIEEANFDSFERELTDHAAEDEVTKGVEKILKGSFENVKLPLRQFADLLTTEGKERLLNYSEYLFSKNNVIDPRGVESSNPLLFVEGIGSIGGDVANDGMLEYLSDHLSSDIVLQPLILRDDDKQCLTLFRLSPHFVCENFNNNNH